MQRDVDKWTTACPGFPASDSPDALEDAFSGELGFGTGGIRAKMGIGPNRLNQITVGRAAQGVACWLLGRTGQLAEVASVVIARDSRKHGLILLEQAASVLAANGIHVFVFKEPTPTPVLSFAVRELRCAAGIVITASHNSREYNGFKVYDARGCQATAQVAREIQEHINAIDPFLGVSRIEPDLAHARGLVQSVPAGIAESYVTAVLKSLSGPYPDLSQLKVAYSPLCGTGLRYMHEILKRAGLDVFEVVEDQAQFDGEFRTCPRPNPEEPAAMSHVIELGERCGCDLALASDPDADRLGVAAFHDGEWRILTGDEVGLLLFDWLASWATQQGPSHKVAVTTIVTSPMADELAEHYGIELRRTLTGFKYIGEQINRLEDSGRLSDFLLGFEESIGYLGGTYIRDKDGMSGALMVCCLAASLKKDGHDLVEAMEGLYDTYGYRRNRQVSFEASSSADLSELLSIADELRDAPPSSLGGLEVTSRSDYSVGAPMPVVNSRTEALKQTLPPSNVMEFNLEGGSRVLIRPSGTEPKVKCYLFSTGKTPQLAYSRLAALTSAIRSLFHRRGHMIHVVLLSGGSGVRLWPLSNGSRTKQFLKVLRDDKGNHISMAQRIFSQIRDVVGDIDITISTSESQRVGIESQLDGDYSLVLEPERRDTAPAIMLACEHLALLQGAHDDDTVIIMPIDTFADQSYYKSLSDLDCAVRSHVAQMVLLGAMPTYPSTKYGYIVPSSRTGAVREVRRFTEKPDEETAEHLIKEGGLWNCGVFAFELGYLRQITRGYIRESSFDKLVERYGELPKNSFDYEVVEKASSLAVLPYGGEWKDLGTWNTLTEEMADCTAGPVVMDEASCDNVHVINELQMPLVVSGLTDAVVVATTDGILVCSKEESVNIKPLVNLAQGFLK